MEGSKGKFCPVISTDGYYVCKESDCAWWCGFAQDCAAPLIAGILADSSINQVKWNGAGDNDFS